MNREAPCIALHGCAADFLCMYLCVSCRVELLILVLDFFTYCGILHIAKQLDWYTVEV